MLTLFKLGFCFCRMVSLVEYHTCSSAGMQYHTPSEPVAAKTQLYHKTDNLLLCVLLDWFALSRIVLNQVVKLLAQVNLYRSSTSAHRLDNISLRLSSDIWNSQTKQMNLTISSCSSFYPYCRTHNSYRKHSDSEKNVPIKIGTIFLQFDEDRRNAMYSEKTQQKLRFECMNLIGPK